MIPATNQEIRNAAKRGVHPDMLLLMFPEATEREIDEAVHGRVCSFCQGTGNAYGPQPPGVLGFAICRHCDDGRISPERDAKEAAEFLAAMEGAFERGKEMKDALQKRP